MPTKWADYAIVAVDYDLNGNHIQCLNVRIDSGEKLINSEYWSRSKIVNHIENGYSFITSTKNPANGQWEKGERVQIVEMFGVKYIRTDSNQQKADNLGNLPKIVGKGCK